MRAVLFLAMLVAAALMGCVRDSGETPTILEPQPGDGSPKKASAAVTPDSREITGVYEGDAAVITVSKVNEAWEINCATINVKYSFSKTYLSLTPFNGEQRSDGLTFNCKTGKKKTRNIYRVAFTKKKFQCREFDEPIIVEYDEQSTQLGHEPLYVNDTPPSLEIPDMDMALLHTDECSEFIGMYPKK